MYGDSLNTFQQEVLMYGINILFFLSKYQHLKLTVLFMGNRLYN